MTAEATPRCAKFRDDDVRLTRLLRNLDDGVLGPRYVPEALALQPPADHFALMGPARVARHIESIIAALG